MDSKKRILVVEDHEATADLIAQLLNDDYEVTICRNLHDGISAAINSSFDLVLTDFNNPVKRGGIEMIKTVRKHCDGIPIILMTGDDLLAVQAEIEMVFPADGYLQKPPDIMGKMSFMIKRCLEMSAKQKAA